MARAGRQVARKEHVVPRLHYARFAFDRQQHLYCLDKVSGALRVTAADRLYIRDFYNFMFAGQMRDDIEMALGVIENRTPRVLKTFDRTNAGASFSFTDQDRYAMSLYLAALHLRSPRMRSWVLDDLVKKASHAVALRFAAAGPRYWGSARALLEGSVRVTPEEQAALVVFRELNRVGRIIFASNWSLAIRPRAPHFVLGDAPGVGFVPPRGGWFLFVPISPERAIAVDRARQEGAAFEMPAANAVRMNALAYEASVHTVAARDKAELDALIP